jgi:hypothetical protein
MTTSLPAPIPVPAHWVGLPGSVRDHEDELSLAELTWSQVKTSGAFARVR